MLFDDLCCVAERQWKQIAPIMKQAALFQVKDRWEDLFARGTVVTAKDVTDKCRLPFPVTAIEDPDGLVIMARVKDDNEKVFSIDSETREGVSSGCFMVIVARRVNEVLQVFTGFVSDIGYCDAPPEGHTVRNMTAGKAADMFSTPVNTGEGEYYSIKESKLLMGLGDPKKVWVNYVVNDKFQEAKQDYFTAVIVALRQATLLTMPGTWAVKHTPAKLRVNEKKIARSGDRVRYLLISDEERKRYFVGVDKETGKTLDRGHPRRGHYRRINTDTQGKPVFTWVRACWVGPEETVIGGVKYTVDLSI